jgi:mRNA capping enzyme, catalytic domain
MSLLYAVGTEWILSFTRIETDMFSKLWSAFLCTSKVSVSPVQHRYMFIKEVVDPRNFEARLISDPAVPWPHRYMYDQEPFKVVCKTFWPLHALPHVQRVEVPKLLHENDGFILQV